MNGFFSTGSTDLDKIAKALGVDASELIESVRDENQAKESSFLLVSREFS